MSYLGTKDFGLEASRGNITGITTVNKFGCSTDCDSGTATDIWDRANSTDTQVVWTAPTTARTHQITSTSASDDGDPAGVGANTVRVYGLTGWGTAEVSEDITMNGTADVPTANSYVIIHRMKVLTKGATSVNVGVITATADTDSTVTAQINASQGQSQMAIYGIPSTQTAYMTNYYASLVKSASATTCSMELIVNPEPDVELTNFVIKHLNGMQSDGSNNFPNKFDPPFSIAGPAIIKIRANCSSSNNTVTAGFDLYLITN